MRTLLTLLAFAAAGHAQIFWGGAGDAKRIRGIEICTTAPTDGQGIVYDLALNCYKPQTVGGLSSLNGQTGATQTFALGTNGNDAAWSSSSSTHTLNLPSSSASNRGLLTAADWSLFNGKESALTFSAPLTRATNTIGITLPTCNNGTTEKLLSTASGFTCGTDQSGGAAENFATSETPSGTVNGTNDTFTLANTPTSGSVQIYRNGLLLVATVDYTISSATITFVSGELPQTGDTIRASYRY